MTTTQKSAAAGIALAILAFVAGKHLRNKRNSQQMDASDFEGA